MMGYIFLQNHCECISPSGLTTHNGFLLLVSWLPLLHKNNAFGRGFRHLLLLACLLVLRTEAQSFLANHYLLIAHEVSEVLFPLDAGG